MDAMFINFLLQKKNGDVQVQGFVLSLAVVHNFPENKTVNDCADEINRELGKKNREGIKNGD